MAYKNILVHVDSTPQSIARIEMAVRLAKKHGAHLTGLYVIMHPLARVTGAEAEVAFNRATAEAGIASEWSCSDCTVAGVSVASVVNLHACLQDLIIVGQTVQGTTNSETPPDLPECVIIGSGKPVLIVPAIRSFKTVGEHTMVCWKYGRESARALYDSLPFLQTARTVRVLAADPPVAAARVGSASRGEIVAYLSRHGITPQLERFVPAEISVGGNLLNEAWEAGCDLLVMGACTSTAGQPAIGPVARDVLARMSLPVLMSH